MNTFYTSSGSSPTEKRKFNVFHDDSNDLSAPFVEASNIAVESRLHSTGAEGDPFPIDECRECLTQGRFSIFRSDSWEAIEVAKGGTR